MEYRKERNFIVAYEDDGTVQGKWNILTGEFIGKSNKVVKTVPRAFTNIRTAYLTPDMIYRRAIVFYRDVCIGYGTPMYTAIAPRFEALISVGLIPATMDDLFSTRKLTPELVNYCKNNLHGEYNTKQVEPYCIKQANIEYLKDRPKWFIDLFIYSISQLPIDYIKTFMNRLVNEHVADFWTDSFEQRCYLQAIIVGYYNMCMDMYGCVKVTPNLLTNYAELMALYKNFKEAHYNEKLKANNDKPFLYFENEQFEARPIFTRNDFHEEAENQHNCVERIYMEKVYNGKTHVVVVRPHNNPNVSFITCEVNNQGRIVQYLAFANARVTNESANNFREQYQQHLMNAICE